MHIRKTNQLEEVKELHKRIFPSDNCDVLETDELWKVMDSSGNAVGFCSIRSLEHKIVFFNWAGLLLKAQGKGLHKRMIRTREKWCRKNGVKSIVTYCVVENIQSARNLIKSGYELFIPEYQWAGKNNLYFIKNL